MGRTSIDVDEDVHGELKKLKGDLRLRTHGDVVRMLLDHYRGRGPAAGSDDDDGDVRRMEEEDEEAEGKKTAAVVQPAQRGAQGDQVLHWPERTVHGLGDEDAVRRGTSEFTFLCVSRSRTAPNCVFAYFVRLCVSRTNFSFCSSRASSDEKWAPFEQRGA
jgi:hypothetical protein